MSVITAVRARTGAWSWAQWMVAALMVAVLASAGVVLHNVVARASEPAYRVPQSAAIEAAVGLRVSRVAVVGDGGLITLSYTALDVEKVQRFQEDRTQVPELLSEARSGGTKRASVMRQGGHNIRAGATYYFVYQNTKGAIQPGEQVTVVIGSLRLEHVPVL